MSGDAPIRIRTWSRGIPQAAAAVVAIAFIGYTASLPGHADRLRELAHTYAVLAGAASVLSLTALARGAGVGAISTIGLLLPFDVAAATVAPDLPGIDAGLISALVAWAIWTLPAAVAASGVACLEIGIRTSRLPRITVAGAQISLVVAGASALYPPVNSLPAELFRAMPGALAAFVAFPILAGVTVWRRRTTPWAATVAAFGMGTAALWATCPNAPALDAARPAAMTIFLVGAIAMVRVAETTRATRGALVEMARRPPPPEPDLVAEPAEVVFPEPATA